MAKWAIGLLVALTALGGALFLYSLLPQQLIANIPRVPPPPPLGDMPETKSYVNVPVSIAISSLEQQLHDAVPTAISIPGRRSTVSVLGIPACIESAPMRFERTRPRLVDRGQRLAVLLRVSQDRVSVKGELGPCRGPVSGPSAYASDLLFDLTITSRAQVADHWELELHDMDVDLAMRQVIVDLGLPYLREINIADVVAPLVEEAVEAELGQRVSAAASSIVTHRDFAKAAWEEICSVVDMPVLPGLQLVIRPTRAYVGIPKLVRQRITLNVGLELVLQARIAQAGEQAHPECPFPSTVGKLMPAPPGFTFAVPADLTFDELESALTALLAGGFVDLSGAAPVVVSDIGVSAHGAGVLLQLTLDVPGEEDWFGRALSGTVYVVAVPDLDVKSQTISLSGIHVDTSSRSVLLNLAGELLEPALESRLQDAVIDLAPIEAMARKEIETGLDLLSENDALQVSLRTLQLNGLEVGVEGLRVLIRVDGAVEVTLDG